jgi:tocopherol cyclase
MRSLGSYLTGIRHPEGFHGQGITKNFFEGWYFKFVSADQSQRWAVIPGIFRGLGGESRDEAFVQVLDGSSGRSWYHRFEMSEFSASPNRFDVRVGGNHFHERGAELDLPQLKGHLEITTALKPWPVTLSSPGIMGWYGLVPFMECFHGIVSFGHDLKGQLEVEGSTVSFDGGKGYIEKDWGKNFPSGYIWLHSNHVESDPQASLVASAAIIPWLRRPFRGFIMGLHHLGTLHRWTTYNGSQEELLSLDDSHVTWRVSGPDGVLELRAERKRGGLLHAPLREAMHQRVEETMDGRIEIRHTKGSKVLLDSVATCGAMEVFGDTERLLRI